MSDIIKKPANVEELLRWEWADFEPAYNELQRQTLAAENVSQWLSDWSLVIELANELSSRLYVATSINTVDKEAEQRFQHFMEKTYPGLTEADQKLKEKLLESGLEPAGFEEPLRRIRVEAEIFRKENIPLQVEEQKLVTEHDKIMGAQTVTWRGEEKTVKQMETVLRENEREARREGWELLSKRQLEDRKAINANWTKFMDLRLKMTKNADQPDYRAYRWLQLGRFAYTPQDCKDFHKAIEEVVVPVYQRISERRAERLGVDSLRYYDLFVDPSGQPPLKPFSDVRDLISKTSAIFHQVLPQFGEYFDEMDRNGLLDLENRKNKAAGGYCTSYAYTRKPFIFANAVGIHDDAQTLLHEGGHSFHDYEAYSLPYFQQRHAPMEFAEVASMGMEMLSAPYLAQEFGGYYTASDAARALWEVLEVFTRFWPYMAIVDAFQHWVYENPQLSINPANCDDCWEDLEIRFRPYIDWSGYEDVMRTGWQRKDHIHVVPFYYIEYGLAELGALQVWANALKDQTTAVERYRKALQLGCTKPLPELFAAAGGKLGFDSQTLRPLVSLLEEKMVELESKY